jgi:dTDP-4-dehydrorhamnose 3,5-epimerase
MKREECGLLGAAVIRPPVHSDERGTFFRVVDVDEFRDLDIDPAFVQLSVATNRWRGTVRGLHYQVAPFEETKTLWCSRGRVFDVLVDLRPDQPTYGQWVSIELAADDPCVLHVPPGVAHGYQTLEADSALTYLIGTAYSVESARTLSWADPTLAITWPLPVAVMSQRDREAPSWPPPSP